MVESTHLRPTDRNLLARAIRVACVALLAIPFPVIAQTPLEAPTVLKGAATDDLRETGVRASLADPTIKPATNLVAPTFATPAFFVETPPMTRLLADGESSEVSGGVPQPNIPGFMQGRLSSDDETVPEPFSALLPPPLSIPIGESLGPDLSQLNTGFGVTAASVYQIEERTDDIPPTVRATQERVLDLYDREERQLVERVRDVVAETQPVDVTDEDWITVRGSGKRITWGGRIDTDWVNWANSQDFGGQQNYVEFRRLRLFAAGEGYGVYEYQLEVEFSPELERIPSGNVEPLDFGVELKDAFLAVRDVPLLGYVMAGHFRTPIGLDERTSTRFNPFMERSLPTRLLPGRELGLAAFNSSPRRNTTGSWGVFFDDLNEARRSIVDDNQGVRVIGRATWLPYYDEASGGRCLLHTGIGASYNRPRKRNHPFINDFRPVRFTALPEINVGDDLIDTGPLDTNSYYVLNGELAWVRGSFSIQSELTWASLDQPLAAESTDLFGAYVFGSYFLTGETRRYDRDFAVFRRVTPYENFWMVPTSRGVQRGWGAWELAYRWSHLNFGDVSLSAQRLNDLTLGLNWYWTPNTRLMFNWIRTYAHSSPIGLETDSEGDIIAMRLQLDF